MFYYEVLVGSAQYHGNEPLTYSYGGDIAVGSVVRVPLQRFSALGVVTGKSSIKPKFKTKDILEVFDLPPLPPQLPHMITWLRTYYPAPLGSTVLSILPSQLTPKTLAEKPEVLPLPDVRGDTLPPLTNEQQTAMSRMQKRDTFLLHGDTGTGKTRVYVELALRAIKDSKSVIVLTPEISLTSQLAKSFTDVFSERVAVVHSGLTPKARQQVWLHILRASHSGQPLIVLGPRSALFAPLQNVGLIIVDESHEPAYKQEQAPHYHAVRVASHLSQLHGASLVLGSATPSIGDYYIAQQKNKSILRMTRPARLQAPSNQQSTQSLASKHLGSAARDRQITSRDPGELRRSDSDVPAEPAVSAAATSNASIQLVDLKDRSKFSRSQYISDPLLSAITTSLQQREQSLLYLNRRGTARVILCNNCGWQAACPHCDLPLTYHHDEHELQCHTCGWHSATPTFCSECKNTDVVFKVVGTKAIEEEIKRLFPHARVMRFDTDNKKAERFEQHYEAVRSGEIDILVGTQLLAKGLDLPKLTTLGVVVADTSLTFPDYSSEERTYQLLNQVIGRVGRGHSEHEWIIVQSYDPQRPVIKAALASDWDTFYASELEERKLFNFPPFIYALKLACRMASSKSAEAKTEQFMYSIRQLGLPLLIEGPSPSFHTKIAGKFEWQLIVKSKQRSALLEVIKALPKSGWSYDIDPINLL